MSTTAEARYPEEQETPEQMEGTAAHWGLERTLNGHTVGLGEIAPNGVPLSQEMIEAIDLFYEDVARELAPHGLRPEQGQIEKPLRIKRVHDLSWGTPDYRIWLPGWHLLMYDFKFGRRYVEVFENPQMIEYVAGSLDEAQATWGILDTQIRVTVKIVQPRSYHRDGPIRSWSFAASDIRALVNKSFNAAHEALGPNPVARVGDECRDCRARHACPTLQAAGYIGCDLAGNAQPFDLPPEAMALEHRMLKKYLKLMEARASGLETQLLALAKSGARTPGYRIEHGLGRERWTIDDAQVVAIGQALGVNVAKPVEAMTPKQAVKAGLPEAVLAGIVTTPRGEAQLVEDDGSFTRRIFG